MEHCRPFFPSIHLERKSYVARGQVIINFKPCEKTRMKKNTSSRTLDLNFLDFFFENALIISQKKWSVLKWLPWCWWAIHITESQWKIHTIWISECPFLFRFSKGITGIRFAKHQRCYIRTQTRNLPPVAEVQADETELLVCVLPRLSVVQTLCTLCLCMTASVGLQRLLCIFWGDSQSYVSATQILRLSIPPPHLASPQTISPKNWLGLWCLWDRPNAASNPITSLWLTSNVFAVNLELILIFNHLLQRLYPNSLKEEGCKKCLSERLCIKKVFFKDYFFARFTRILPLAS